LKIHPLGTELFHAERRTDMTKLIVAFRNFVNASKDVKNSLLMLCDQLKLSGQHKVTLCNKETSLYF